jgi:micrococcal nuclease
MKQTKMSIILGIVLEAIMRLKQMRQTLQSLLLTLLITVSLSGCAQGQRVCSVHDGDTFNTCDGQRIRLGKIDAPELRQCFGKEARNALSTLVLNQNVTLNCSDSSYDWQVCQVGLNGKDINGEIVRLGYAFDYPQYSHGLNQAQERAAKVGGLGVWQFADGGKRPWEYRHSDNRNRKKKNNWNTRRHNDGG